MKDILKICGISLLISCVLLGSYIVYDQGTLESSATENRIVNYKSSVDSDIENLYKEVVDGVVFIKTETNNGEGTGSGFVYDIRDGYAYILTNQHVVEDGLSFEVITNTEDVIDDVEYLGGDSFYDVAVLKVKATDSLIKLPLGDVDEHNVGEYLLAVGSPLGEDYINSATLGILSGKDRFVLTDEYSTWGLKLIQTDTPINPGNSGGPLFAMDGTVIGINSLKFNVESVEGMGFAIPTADVYDKLELLEQGKPIRPSLGIQIKTSNDSIIITKVMEDSVLKEFDVKVGSKIKKINDDEIEGIISLRKTMYDLLPGDKIIMVIEEDGIERTIEVELGSYEN